MAKPDDPEEIEEEEFEESESVDSGPNSLILDQIRALGFVIDRVFWILFITMLIGFGLLLSR